MGCAVDDFVKAAIVVGVDFTDYGLHGHPVARVLARKEDAEHRADKQPDKADNEYHGNGNPPARHDCRYQSLCACDNRLDCRKGGFDRQLYGVGCHLGGGFRCLCRFLGCLYRSLCCRFRCLGGLLRGLNRRLRGGLGGLDAFLRSFDRTLGGGSGGFFRFYRALGSGFYRFFSISGGGFDGLLSLLSCLDKTALCFLACVCRGIGGRGTARRPVMGL